MNDEMKQFIAAYKEFVAVHKAAGTPPNAQYLHGPTGLLSTPGLDPKIVSAMLVPKGLTSMLPVRLSVSTDRIVGILTGMTASSGEEPDAACEDFPQAGNFKMCEQTMPFGRIGRETQIVQVDRAGDITNRGEWLDHEVVNNPFAGNQESLPFDPRNFLRDEAARALAALTFAINRDYARLIFTGNPANTAGSEGYIEYNGLAKLVNTGYQDATTGVACPAADSLIVDFGNVNVNADGAITVRTITEAYNSRKYLADRLGINVAFKLVGSYGLFRALTRMWPCAYETSNCAVPEGSTNFVSASEQVKLRDDMWNNRYLLIDGDRVEFVIDDGIAQTAVSAGLYSSELYILPFGVVGGEPTLYWEYRDMRASNPVIEALAPTGSFQVMGGGRYLLHKKPPTNECIAARLIARLRLILRTPFLAVRITNIRYTTYINERSPFPGDANFYNGGNTEYPAPSFYPFAS